MINSRKQPRIFFVRGGLKISFVDWLVQQRLQLGLSWNKLSEKAGVPRLEAYACKMSGGKPNCPPMEKFQKIISYFNVSLDDFEINGTLVNHEDINYQNRLEQIAEAAITRDCKNAHIIRSPLVKKIAGPNFYAKYVKRSKGMGKIVRDIVALNPERYGHLISDITLQNQAKPQSLADFEKDIIEATLVEFDDIKRSRGKKNMPNGLYDIMHQRLVQAGSTRSRDSMKFWAYKIWNGHDPQKLAQSVINPRYHILEEHVERFEKYYKEPSKDWGEVAEQGHNTLVKALALNPELIEPGLELISVEYNFTNSNEKNGSWARADILYKDQSGKLLVVEVKQNARDVINGNVIFYNGLKATEQTTGYKAALEARLNYCPLTTSLKIPVRGMLAAYDINNNTKEALKKSGCESGIIDKKLVRNYLCRRII